MGKTWVLHTETKGTGAQMVPLEEVPKRSDGIEPIFVRRKPVRNAEPPTSPTRAPRTFKVIDVVTRQTLVEGADTREALDVLRDVRSTVDVSVYVWQEERERWRLLTLGEQRTMLELSRA
jgi:hypothetical protein